jgi:hypothetical protein
MGLFAIAWLAVCLPHKLPAGVRCGIGAGVNASRALYTYLRGVSVVWVAHFAGTQLPIKRSPNP